jgi:pimeloyl-ACP methyl ester carboxylesterase
MQGIQSKRFLFAVVAFLLLSLAAPSLQAAVTTRTGTFADGATYLIEVPSPWNGMLLLYSHGYVVPGSSNPARDVGDSATRSFLLANGFALAGSSYAHAGWAIQEALVDQIEVLDTFNAMFGNPQRTIAWGHSLGGIITAGLVQQNPHRFDGALPMCGVLSGGVATWNQALDGAFAFKTLFNFGGPLQVVNIADPAANFVLAEGLLSAAQATPQGRARWLPPWVILRAGSMRLNRNRPPMTSLPRKQISSCGSSRWTSPSFLLFALSLSSAPGAILPGTQA